MDLLIKDGLQKSISYEAYRTLFKEFSDAGKTSGENQSGSLVNYTKLNWSRANRVDKKIILEEGIKQQLLTLTTEIDLLIITEMWCGDAAQVVPVIAKMAEISPTLSAKIIFRDENPELMSYFLTNGGQSIPKIIIIKKDSLQVLGHWGPRPEKAQELVMHYKQLEEKPSYHEFATQMQMWYNNDKGISIQKEFWATLLKALD